MNRKKFIRERRNLSLKQRKKFGRQASCHLHKLQHRLPRIKTANKKPVKVGIYYDDFGELPTQPILDWCARLGYEAYLPVVGTLGKKDKRLRFAPTNSRRLINLPTYHHQLGMQQQRNRKLIWAKQLDIIFCPLVAVDLLGTRMGMGGGYYDRTLAHCHKFKLKKPLRIAWCYDFQFVHELNKQTWDVPMDLIITPSYFYRVPKSQVRKSVLKSSTADSVSLHLQKLEQEKIMSTSSDSFENAKFSEQELATLINPKRLQDLLNQADGFLHGLEGLIESYEGYEVDENNKEKEQSNE